MTTDEWVEREAEGLPPFTAEELAPLVDGWGEERDREAAA